MSRPHRHNVANRLQTGLILVAMAGLLMAVGYLLLGGSGLLWAGLGTAMLVGLNPMMSPGMILRLYRSRRLTPRTAPDLVGLVERLAQRAGLATVPELHYVPSPIINAFAVGTRRASAVAVSHGLLRTLSPRELSGVLAHEISHVAAGDTKVMMLADLFSRLTGLLSNLGQILLFLNLPLLLFSDYGIPWSLIILLILAPSVSVLLQLALSRAREYDADRAAAELTGDPRGLASALAKMERYQGGFFEQIVLPGRRVPEPSLLRTHPETEDRVRRLLELEERQPEESFPTSVLSALAAGPTPRPPRWRVPGIWY
ncbi:MAG: M48 family metalloprotease [Gemmatimonadetes bacterium]|nr:M48 family metalloprotease [Gemmatimonadota bacterium]